MSDEGFSARSDADLADRAARRTLRQLRQQWRFPLALAIVAGVVVFAVSSSQDKQYDTSATLEVRGTDTLSNYLGGGIDAPSGDPERATSAAVQLLTLPSVRTRASGLLARRLTPDQIQRAVSVSSEPDSGVVTVTARAGSARLAKDTANATVQAFLAQRFDAERQRLRDTRARVSARLQALPEAERNSEAGRTLRERLRTIDVLGTLGTTDITIADAAPLPTEAVSPNPVRDAILGVIGGLVLGLLIAFVRARFDDRIRDAAEYEELWDLPIAGVVPRSASLKDQGNWLPESEALEALSLARTNLRYLQVGGTIKVVMITSALASEGKSTVAWNLAIASSLSSMRVLLIEGDLRRPKLSQRLELRGPGLSEVLVGLANTADAIQSIEVRGGVHQAATRVDVLPAGAAPPSSIALFEDPLTRTVLRGLADEYDVVYIDTPPATVVGDAVALADTVDGVIILSRPGVATRAAYRRLREILEGAGARVLGQITNGEGRARTYDYSDPKATERAMAASGPSTASNDGSTRPERARHGR